MDMQFKGDFIRTWQKYFNNADLPITFYYSDDEGHAGLVKPDTQARCIMGPLVKIRRGASFVFDAESVGCSGGRGFLGFSSGKGPELEPDSEYFLSYGIPGKMEGERFKKSPEMVKGWLSRSPQFTSPAKYAIFKRWDNLQSDDNPEVVVFFVKPDVLSGLYNLANFDSSDPNTVIAPWGSGCSSIIQDPYLEKRSANPRAVIGMFDSSARPFVATDELTLSVPINKFMSMVGNIEESFLITHSWELIRKRIK
jgi:uncharacterized protein (DUF169 family)